MLPNFDVWHEIIGYLDYPEDELTLRSLATVSRTLSDLALDAIWRDGRNHMTIVSVINSFAASPDQPLLKFTNENGCDGEGLGQSPKSTPKIWVSYGPLPHAACTRALEYLAKIRNLTLSLSSPPGKEEQLWPALSNCLGNLAPLEMLPNLRYLELNKATHDCTYFLAFLVSSALETLKFTGLNITPEHKSVLPVLDLVKASSCDLRAFLYEDKGPVQRTLEAVMSFKSLQEVQILRYQLQLKESSVTVVEFLASLPSLCSLACNLTAFPPCTTEDTVCHNNLTKIRIVSPVTTLYEFFRRCALPSVTNADLFLHSSEILYFENIESCCPNIRRLYISTDIDNNCNTVYFRHLAPLLRLPIRSFELMVNRLDLTPADFRAMSRSWPNLDSFTICPREEIEFDILASLAAFSGHPHLANLNLGITALHLLDSVNGVPKLVAPYVATQRPPSNPCTLFLPPHLYPNERRSDHTTGAEKQVLVEFLLSLFPRLKLVPLDLIYPLEFSLDGQAFKGLQGILLELEEKKDQTIGLA